MRVTDDVNAAVASYLQDLAYAQASPPQMWGYKRAAAAIRGLETPLTDLIEAGGTLPRIRGIGPASTRVIQEVLESGTSPTVERAIDASGKRVDIDRRRGLRSHFLSRAKVLRVLGDPDLPGPRLSDYQGDLQMHSEWSDGQPTLAEIAAACHARGYRYAAVTDHSHGLRIAGGMSMEDAAAQRRAIVELNAASSSGFRLLQGIEANIGLDGTLDLSDEEAETFELVLAAPHSRLRRAEDQTPRLLRALEHRHVRILAHPRGRITGSRAGIVADWDAVFAAAAGLGVAIEIDGDPARQDVDYVLAARAMAAGCYFALDSDAHTTTQLAYAETAVAHARLAGIPLDRIVNCWPLEQLLAWIADRLIIGRQSVSTRDSTVRANVVSPAVSPADSLVKGKLVLSLQHGAVEEDSMAQPAGQRLTEEQEKRIAEEAKAIQKQQETEPEREGDILGLSDASPAVEIPRATDDRSGNPAGIEVRTPTTGTSELKRTDGATGIQMGAAGSGTDLDPDQDRPAAARRDLND